MEFLQYISIVIEAIIAIMGLLLALKKNRIYGYGIFLTFAIYVFYDLSKLTQLAISQTLLSILFFIATLSALWAVWKIYSKMN